MPLSFEHRPSLVAYLTCGDPNLDTSRDIALAAIEAGADVIELGVPFSDPVADGPVIQRASERALRAGTTLQKVLWLAKEIRQRSQAGLIIFTYLNPIIRMGFAKFSAEVADAGIDGALITDLPVEESRGYLSEMQQRQFSAVGKFADAAVVGSAIVQTIERNPGKEAQSVAQFVGSLVVGR